MTLDKQIAKAMEGDKLTDPKEWWKMWHASLPLVAYEHDVSHICQWWVSRTPEGDYLFTYCGEQEEGLVPSKHWPNRSVYETRHAEEIAVVTPSGDNHIADLTNWEDCPDLLIWLHSDNIVILPAETAAAFCQTYGFELLWRSDVDRD